MAYSQYFWGIFQAAKGTPTVTPIADSSSTPLASSAGPAQTAAAAPVPESSNPPVANPAAQPYVATELKSRGAELYDRLLRAQEEERNKPSVPFCCLTR